MSLERRKHASVPMKSEPWLEANGILCVGGIVVQTTVRQAKKIQLYSIYDEEVVSNENRGLRTPARTRSKQLQIQKKSDLRPRGLTQYTKSTHFATHRH